MTINDIITKYYALLKSRCHNDYKVISLSRTSEDVLQDVCLTALRKFKAKPICEGEGLEYLERTLYFELKFQVNRIDPRLTYVEDLGTVDRIAEN